MGLRIVIVEDNLDYGAKLESLLTRDGGDRVVDRFVSALPLLESAKSQARRGIPAWDLALLDLCLPGMSGIEAARRLGEILPQLPVVMFTVFAAPAPGARETPAAPEGEIMSKTSTQDLLRHFRSLIVSSPSEELPGGRRRLVARGLRPSTLDRYARWLRKRR